MAMHVLLLTNTKSVFPTEGFRLGVYFLVFPRQCVRLVVFQGFLWSLKGRFYHWLTHERTFLRWCVTYAVVATYTWRRCISLSWSQRTTSGTTDPAQHMDLCQWITAHPQLLSVILFTDEASFTRDGTNNSRNLHTCSHDNPHETSVTKFQRRFSVNVWRGLLVTVWSDLLSSTTI